MLAQRIEPNGTRCTITIYYCLSFSTYFFFFSFFFFSHNNSTETDFAFEFYFKYSNKRKLFKRKSIGIQNAPPGSTQSLFQFSKFPKNRQKIRDFPKFRFKIPENKNKFRNILLKMFHYFKIFADLRFRGTNEN